MSFANLSRLYRSLELERRAEPRQGLRVEGAPSVHRRVTAGDDPGVGVSVELSATARSLARGMRNVTHAVGAVDAADGALADIADRLEQMRELAERAETGTPYLNAKYVELRASIDTIVDKTTFERARVLDGSYTRSVQAGPNAGSGDRLTFTLPDVGVADLGLTGSTVSTIPTAEAATVALDDALTEIEAHRANLATTRSRLERGYGLLAEHGAIVGRAVGTRVDAVRSGLLAQGSEHIRASAAAPLTGTAVRAPLSEIAPGRLQDILGDVTALREAVEAFDDALDGTSEADVSDRAASVTSEANLGLLAGDTREADRPLAELPAFSGVRRGTVRVNGAPIAVDPDKDSLSTVLSRITSSSAGVDATLVARDQRVKLEARDPLVSLELDGGNTGLFEALGLSEGVVEARTGDAAPVRGRKALTDLADRLNDLLATIDRGGEGATSLARLRGSIASLFTGAARAVDERFRTEIGVTVDFGGSLEPPFPFDPASQARLEEVLASEPDEVRAFFKEPRSGGQGLLRGLRTRLEDLEAEIGAVLDQRHGAFHAVA